MSDKLMLDRCVEEACQLAKPSIELAIRQGDKRNALCLIVLDPRKPYTAHKALPSVLNENVFGETTLPILKETVFGEQDKSLWARDYRKIARSKAMICWRTGMSSREVGEKAPYLYLGGDTKFPGGVVCDDLVVAASGLDWQLDEACAHTVIAFFWAQTRLLRDEAMANKDTIFF